MGITVLLAFSVFLLRMGEDLPETSEFIPLLSKIAFFPYNKNLIVVEGVLGKG